MKVEVGVGVGDGVGDEGIGVGVAVGAARIANASEGMVGSPVAGGVIVGQSSFAAIDMGSDEVSAITVGVAVTIGVRVAGGNVAVGDGSPTLVSGLRRSANNTTIANSNNPNMIKSQDLCFIPFPPKHHVNAH